MNALWHGNRDFQREIPLERTSTTVHRGRTRSIACGTPDIFRDQDIATSRLAHNVHHLWGIL